MILFETKLAVMLAFLASYMGKHPRNKHSNLLAYINVYLHVLSLQTGAVAPCF